MIRISKAPDDRRDELLDIALRLCAGVGYDALSIDQVTRAAGVAKGTFYYHFASKQDMLIALVERFVDEMFVELEAASHALTGTGLERFRQLMVEATAWKTRRTDDALAFIPLLYKPENLELRHRLYESWTARTRQLFLPLVELGAADGSLNLPPDADPAAMADLVMSLWLDGSTRVFDRALACEDADAFTTIATNGISALSTAAERVLGAAPGSFTVPYDDAVVRAMHAPFLAALHGTAPTLKEPQMTSTAAAPAAEAGAR